jgi:hypothetical protein
MYPKKIAQDTAQVLRSYFTYQSVKLIIDQLAETNPPLALWLSHFTSDHNIQNGEVFLEEMMNENKEMVLRILTVRQDLAENILDILPEMVNTGIVQANIEHRRKLLERLTSSPQESEKIDPQEQ